MIQPSTVLYASDDSDASVAEARAYIAREGLTGEDVRLIRKEGQVLVVAKRMPESWRKKWISMRAWHITLRGCCLKQQ